MGRNRFAQLSLEEQHPEDDTKNNKQTVADGDAAQNSAHPSRRIIKKSANFTWKVLVDDSISKTVPRGLVNRSNFCYLNAVLQPLLLCQPFVNIIANLEEQIREDVEQFKWLSAFLELIEAFKLENIHSSPSAVSPECVYRCWEHTEDQEDAEEFLRLILSGIHGELLAKKDHLKWTLPSSKDNPVERETVENEWMSVDKRNRKATLRSLLEPPSPLSVLFNGQFKSVVKGSGVRDSHVYEPFQFLPLDVPDDTGNLLNAITHLTTTEQVSPKLSRQLLIDRLPPILIIHLKRFIFDSRSMNVSKSFSDVDIPMTLDLSKQVMNWGDSVFFSPDQPPVYSLQAVIYHMGRGTHGGHYVCHVLHDGVWYHCDDGSVSRINTDKVGKRQNHIVPYLLFYIRTN